MLSIGLRLGMIGRWSLPAWVDTQDADALVADIANNRAWNGVGKRAVPLTDWINGSVVSGALLTALQASTFSWVLEATTNTGSTQVIIQVDDGTNANRVLGYLDSAGLGQTRMFVGGVGAGNSFTANTITSGVPFKIAAGVSGSAINVALNGGTAVSISHALGMPPRTAARFGAGIAGAAPFTGTISKITVKPGTVFSAADCVSRSA